ncbi:hypothetical protein KGQ19_14645 [Catenulispora sp. NL8]|uniref:Shikimate kinase n=1 Tax=Catenulispora pinistramenti TaxID=2705254 RepID=A0ABS5KPY2_9ACTN|nr:AAA family ATPase [Catenulispora pinistramenti]MBS2548103.1 hypothetical protein [Catenulispora pinistramenti]
MALVWVTGNAGVGKSTVCSLLKGRGERAIDADWDGYNQWVDRVTGEVVVDPPYPAPPGWLDGFGWQIGRPKVEALAEESRGTVAYLFGTVENEVQVWDLFDVVVCLVVDDQTLRHRLLTRTTNAFGKHPEELAATLGYNENMESTYRGFGALVLDGTRPVAQIADAILAAGREALPAHPANP